ncbi:MAG: murein biosynthesis integral membrane protein MurJ [Erysipelothrix sp.]|nr:murein biosynthesis integral membrane protein MurJ [Erysipelothrix sp.]
MNKNQNMKKSAIILFVLMIMSKILGLLRESIMNHYYKPGLITNAYTTASSIPNFMFGIVAAGLIATFIPIYSQIIQKEGKERANKFMNNALTSIFIMTIILLAFGLLFTEQLVKINAAGYKGEQLAMAVDFTRVALFALLTNGVFSIFSGYQQYENRFYVAPMTGFLLNGAIISSIIISNQVSRPIIMVYGLVLGSLLQLLFSVIISYSQGDFRYKFTVNMKDQYIKPMMIMALPIIFGSSITQINGLIDRSIASTLGAKSVTIINYANRINDAVFSLFVSSLTTVMYPAIINQANKKDYAGLKSTITEIMNLTSLIVIPATIGVTVLANPIVTLFFKNDADVTYYIVIALIGATVGLFGMSIKDILVKTFYSLNDSKTPVFASIVQIIVNIVLNFALAPWLNVAGLTLATSISAYVGAIILYLTLSKRLNGLKTRALISSVSRISIASLAMGLVVFGLHSYLNTLQISFIVNLALSVIAGGSVYVIGIWILKVPEFYDVIYMIKDKLKIGSKA